MCMLSNTCYKEGQSSVRVVLCGLTDMGLLGQQLRDWSLASVERVLDGTLVTGSLCLPTHSSPGAVFGCLFTGKVSFL